MDPWSCCSVLIRSQAHLFKYGNCDYRDLFSSPELTYEAEIPYFLRYMLDNEVGKTFSGRSTSDPMNTLRLLLFHGSRSQLGNTTSLNQILAYLIASWKCR